MEDPGRISLLDMWVGIKSMMKPSNLKLMFSRRRVKEPEHPGEF